MTVKDPNPPIFEDKNGNIRIALFKNKNIKGNTYPLYCITVTRYPFKFTRKIYVSPNEIDKLKDLLENLPEIKRK